jgi:RNA polymerase sigma-70 factor (ECF subfamily)
VTLSTLANPLEALWLSRVTTVAPSIRPARSFAIIRSMPAAGEPSISKNTQASPEPLLPRIAAGDQRAVQEFTDRYGGLVWSLARRLAWGESDAEDAVQEIFIDLWRSAARFDPSVASEVTFVAMIARRRLIDRRRRQSRQPDTSAIHDGMAASAALPEDRAQLNQEAAVALDAMSELSQEQQRVLRLSIFHGLSHDRIARATGLPLGTVKTHARRGLIRIRELLEAKDARRQGEVAT